MENIKGQSEQASIYKVIFRERPYFIFENAYIPRAVQSACYVGSWSCLYSVAEIFYSASALTSPKMEDDDSLEYSTWCERIHSTYPDEEVWRDNA